jgi:hypothetical protein
VFRTSSFFKACRGAFCLGSWIASPDRTTHNARARKISKGLPDLENIAFRVVAIADFGAFKFPFALDGIYGAAPLCRPISNDGYILDREHELNQRVFTALRGRRNVDRVRNVLRNPTITSCDDSPLRTTNPSCTDWTSRHATAE